MHPLYVKRALIIPYQPVMMMMMTMTMVNNRKHKKMSSTRKNETHAQWLGVATIFTDHYFAFAFDIDVVRSTARTHILYFQ
jgi:hypothetical protein